MKLAVSISTPLLACLLCLATHAHGQQSDRGWNRQQSPVQELTHQDNPLRSQPFQAVPTRSENTAGSVRLVAEPQPDYRTAPGAQTMLQAPPVRQDVTTIDAQVSQAVHNEAVNRSYSNDPTPQTYARSSNAPQFGSETSGMPSPTPEKNFIERMQEPGANDAASNGNKSPRLGEIIARLGMNLAIVLGVCLCVILVIKQYFLPTTNSSTSPEPQSAFEILETLKVDEKVTLRVVKYRDTTILLATDTEGIKSVEILEKRFDELIESELNSEANETTAAEDRGEAETYSPQAASSSNSVDENVLSLLLRNASRPRAA